MANLNLMVFENGKPRARQSASNTLDLLSVRIGTDNLTLSDVSGNFDFGGVKLVNVTAGSTTGHVVEYTQFNTALANYIPLTQKAANSGIATLDSGGKIPLAQLPASLMEYQGTWNASTNTPTLADGTGVSGYFYRVNVAGTQNLGSGAQTFVVGDWIMYNGTIWQLAHSGADAVVSVNGFAGVVSLTTDNISEGTTNLYYTTARFNTAFSTKSTTDLAEGTNLYFTTARAQTAAVANSITSGVTNVAPSQDAVYKALLTVTPNYTRSFTNDNAAAISAGQIVYVKANGNVDLAIATIANLSDFDLGIVSATSIASLASGAVTILTGALVAGFTALTPGKREYVSAVTAGALTETAPSASGQSVYSVGRAISTTQIVYDPQFITEIV